MPDRELTQAEADVLLSTPKKRVNDTTYLYPIGGKGIIIPLVSMNGTEKFLLDVTRGRINLSKVTYQTRAHQTVVLARLDLGGPPHRNPDDEEIPCPHLHVYREGFADKWAVPAPTSSFPNPQDLWQSLEDFMIFCHIIDVPNIDRGISV